MRLGDVLYSYLSGHVGLVALIDTRIYPADKIPQNVAAPYVPFKQVNREKNYSLSGYSGSSIYSEQISMYAKTEDNAELIAEQILAAMEAWPAANSKIGYALLENEIDATWVDALELYCIDLDFEIFYEE